MRNTNKKGFTIVELVIVVAVIAILAAVLIPTFSGIIRKANESKDNQLIKNLNTAIAADVDGDKTMAAAIAAAAEFGFDLAKIDAKVEGNEILWDSVANVFCYLNDGTVEYLGEVANKGAGAQLWIIDTDGDDKTHDTYSSYVANVEAGKTVVANHSIDTTACEGVNVEYKGANNVDIYTNGGVLTVDAPSATVDSFGYSTEVYVNAVSANTFNLYGKAGYLEVAAGQHVVLKSGSKVNAIFADASSNVEVKNGQPESIVVTSGDKEAVKTGATLFAGGVGTEANPYLVENAVHMMNIATNYGKVYAYYKVADGVTEIDFNGGSLEINLCGNFDGNNVTFKNLNSSVFNTTNGDANGATGVGNVIVKNFTVEFGSKNDSGVIYYNTAKYLTIENVTVHGYVEDTMNTASFIDYAGVNNQSEHHITFNNCKSDATVVIIGNPAAGFIGHPYSNADSTFNFNNSEYTGKVYSTGGASSCKTYFAGWVNGKVYVDGTLVDGNSIKATYAYGITKVTPPTPEKYDVFSVEKAEGFSYAEAILTIGPNGNGTTVIGGYYCGDYIVETSNGENATLVVDDNTITTSQIKFFDITSNGNATTETGISADGKIFNVVNDKYNNEIGGASVKIVQYDALGNIICVAEWDIGN